LQGGNMGIHGAGGLRIFCLLSRTDISTRYVSLFIKYTRHSVFLTQESVKISIYSNITAYDWDLMIPTLTNICIIICNFVFLLKYVPVAYSQMRFTHKIFACNAYATLGKTRLNCATAKFPISDFRIQCYNT